MTVRELIDRLADLPEHLPVAVPHPAGAHPERPSHLPIATATVRAVRERGGIGGFDLDGAHDRTLVWRPDDEPVSVVVLGAD